MIALCVLWPLHSARSGGRPLAARTTKRWGDRWSAHRLFKAAVRPLLREAVVRPLDLHRPLSHAFARAGQTGGGYLWSTYGLLMAYLWITYGLLMGYLCIYLNAQKVFYK